MFLRYIVAFSVSLLVVTNALTPCNRRLYDQDSFVCVCDSKGCDDFAPVGDLSAGKIYTYSTSLKNDRLTQTIKRFEPKPGRDLKVTIDTTKKYQTILGFGGAITDSVVSIRNDLSTVDESLAEVLHQQYYGPKGIQYTIGRVPLASCDYSDGEYSFLETENDFNLKSFKLDDIKSDYLRKVMKEVPNMKLFASPWSAPGWMKTTGRMTGAGELKGPFNRRFYLVYARYIIRFFEEYQKRNVTFWGFTIQNEPDTGLLDDYPFQTMYMSAQMQRDFVNLRLGPMMKNNWVTKDIKIMAGDGWRNMSYETAETVYNIENDKTAIPGDYTAGIAVHWYESGAPFSVLTRVHNIKPDKFILATEACNSYDRKDQIPYFGRWLSAELYAHDIIQDLKNWVVGWTDWNLWLNTWGGPNWVGNFVDAPILVNITKGFRQESAEFFKQPMYYALAHFTKFIPPNSVIVDLQIQGQTPGNEEARLEGIAALTPDGNVVLVVHNREDDYTYKMEIDDLNHNGQIIRLTVEPKSIKTLIWSLKK